MAGALVINVRFHDGRYHGAGDWPPTPARLFQALVAGVGLSGPLEKEDTEALTWLGNKCGDSPPVIGAPVASPGQQVRLYMPNNDMDRVGGDPLRIAEVRTATKLSRPYVFDPSVPFLYVWPLEQDEELSPHPHMVCRLAKRLYQLGRGVDMAWAWGEVLDAGELDLLLARYPGQIYRPSGGGRGTVLLCPHKQSLTSLQERYQSFGKRFATWGSGKRAFTQPPKPSFSRVAYDSTPSQRVYDLSVAWPLARASALVVALRDLAVHRLEAALPAREEEILRTLVGRSPDGSNGGPASARVRIIPLPSIGHFHADRAIRRILVEVPASCPLNAADVDWAFSGLEFNHPTTGLAVTLTLATDTRMLDRYGADQRNSSRIWRSVTPLALAEPEGWRSRFDQQVCTAASVRQALRHVDVFERPQVTRVQREPFDARGLRAEEFAEGTRFAPKRLWHVEIAFAVPLSGPLVVGDGRFLGLGVMAPIEHTHGIHALAIESGLVHGADTTEVARALRRAVMARVQSVLGSAALPTFFSGHGNGGAPARSERSSHLAFAFDPVASRLLVIAPHVLDHRVPTKEESDNLKVLERAIRDLRELRAGHAGRLALNWTWVNTATDPLIAPSRTWTSVTPYQVTRHAKKVGAAEALSVDLRAECRRHGLPEPIVTPLQSHGVSGAGLIGSATLTFAVAVQGPIVLGRSRHLGGGLFIGADSRRESASHGVRVRTQTEAISDSSEMREH